MILELEPFFRSCERHFSLSWTPEPFFLQTRQQAVRVEAEKPVCVTMDLEADDRLFHRLSGNFLAESSCDRCLRPVMLSIEADSSLVFPVEEEHLVLTDGEQETDGFCPDDSHLDEQLLLQDALYNAFPSKVLCVPETDEGGCRGLCPVCGADLNRTECGCDRTVIDPRMQKFQDVFAAFSPQKE